MVTLFISTKNENFLFELDFFRPEHFEIRAFLSKIIKDYIEEKFLTVSTQIDWANELRGLFLGEDAIAGLLI